VHDDNELRSLVVRIGDRLVEDGWDRIARYCGLDWSNGTGETWAFRYYDAIWGPPDNHVTPVDVVTAAALHPSLTRADLAFFHDERATLEQWLVELPTDRGLAGADEDITRHLAELAAWDCPASLQLLTKVLHRKRPLLIPLVDRHVLDWYRPITGERSGTKAWPALLHAIQADLGSTATIPLQSMATAVEAQTSKRISILRVLDIIVWMGTLR
jgi:hypothetical protein